MLYVVQRIMRMLIGHPFPFLKFLWSRDKPNSLASFLFRAYTDTEAIIFERHGVFISVDGNVFHIYIYILRLSRSVNLRWFVELFCAKSNDKYEGRKSK